MTETLEPAAPARPVRAACTAVWAGVGAFVVLMGAAMAVYPGGTWYDPGAEGYRFWTNFLCDLLRAQALGGKDNEPAAALSRAGMLAVVVSMVPLWWAVSALAPARPRLGRAVRVAGWLSVALLLVVPFASSDRVGAWHSVVVMAAVAAGLVAGGIGVTVTAGASRALAGLGVATLGVVALDAAAYAREAFSDATPWLGLPALQKISTALVLAWMLGVCARVRRLAAQDGQGRGRGQGSRRR